MKRQHTLPRSSYSTKGKSADSTHVKQERRCHKKDTASLRVGLVVCSRFFFSPFWSLFYLSLSPSRLIPSSSSSSSSSSACLFLQLCLLCRLHLTYHHELALEVARDHAQRLFLVHEHLLCVGGWVGGWGEISGPPLAWLAG